MKIRPYRSPVQLLLIMTVAIYTVEFMVMLLLLYFPHESPIIHALIDSTLLIILLVPFLYFFLFRPLLIHISGRRKVEEDLTKERDKAQKYLDVAGVMLLVIDRDGVVRLINKKGCEILGYSEEEVVGRDWFDNFLPERERLTARRAFVSLLVDEKGERPFHEGPVLTRSGDERTILWHHTVLRENGRILGTLSSGEDITERKRVEGSLRESEMRYRLIHDTAFDAIIMADEKGRIIECNPSAEKMFGYERGELAGRALSNLMPEKYREAHQKGLRRFIATGVSRIQGRVLELEGMRKNGDVFPVELIVNHFRLGERIYFSGTIRDITERKRAEKEKEMIQAQLNQAQKMEAVGRLAGGIAHDFNNILTAIRGNAELAAELVSEGDPVRDELKEIIMSVFHAAKLTRQLLLFSRGHPFELQPLSLNAAVEGILKMLNRLLGEDIEIKVETAPELWMVRADEGNMEQVILNLAVNARDSMPEGGTLTIRTENVVLEEYAVKRMPGARPGRAVCLTVSDTGVGMTREVLGRIFEPFFTTKETGKGTGLGLAVVYGIVRQHGGWITVDSTLGKGTTFRVYLPALEKAEATVSEKRRVAGMEDMRGHGERILVVEDDDKVRRMARKALAENNYRVFEATSAEEARSLIEREGGFDLVFSDIVLPDRNGVEFVEGLLEKEPGLPVILTSGYIDDRANLDGLRARGYRFLQKPYSITDLLTAVNGAIEKRKRGSME